MTKNEGFRCQPSHDDAMIAIKRLFSWLEAAPTRDFCKLDDH